MPLDPGLQGGPKAPPPECLSCLVGCRKSEKELSTCKKVRVECRNGNIQASLGGLVKGSQLQGSSSSTSSGNEAASLPSPGDGARAAMRSLLYGLVQFKGGGKHICM